MSRQIYFFLTMLVLLASLLLGGGTRAGHLSDVILQLICLPCLLLFIARALREPERRRLRVELWFCAALATVPLLQLVPLPPAIWTHLALGDVRLATLTAAGAPDAWMPISIDPGSTWQSFLALIPVVSVFVGTATLDAYERREMSLVLLAFCVLSGALGLFQIAQGPDSALRFFTVTNVTEAVGFFANRNHFAALMYCGLVLAAAWGTERFLLQNMQPAVRFDTQTTISVLAVLAVFAVLIAGEAMGRSRAGLGLSIGAMLASLILGLGIPRPEGEQRASNRILVTAIAVALVFVMQYSLFRIFERFGTDPLTDARIPIARSTLAGAKATLPFGTGMGTFVPSYAAFERPEDALLDTYANHAHNDYLEWALDSGLFAALLLVMFLVWFWRRSAAVWARPKNEEEGLLMLYPRAATVIVLLLLAHSFVDYPLRTSAMGSVAAFACGLITLRPKVGARDRRLVERRGQSVRVHVPAPMEVAHPAQDPAHKTAHDNRWGRDVDWPDEWKQKAGAPPPGDET